MFQNPSPYKTKINSFGKTNFLVKARGSKKKIVWIKQIVAKNGGDKLIKPLEKNQKFLIKTIPKKLCSKLITKAKVKYLHSAKKHILKK
jgi:hypothetical protein